MKLQRTAPALYPPVVPDLRIEEHGRIRELARGRSAPVTVAVVLALAPLPIRGQEGESVEGGRLLGRDPRIAPAACALVLGETVLDPRIDIGLVETALAMTGLGLLTDTDHVDSIRVPQLAGELAELRRRSRDRDPSSTDRSRSRGEGRRARRELQEGVETVKVSQAPVVSEAPAEATPVARGASLAALPSAVQDLARFFLSLSGSSSLGAVGGVAGVAASTAGSRVQLCPSTNAGGAVALGAATAIPAGASGPPAAPAAVPSVSGHQQRQEASRSGRRRCRSSSDGTDRRSKKRPRGRSPSPGHSSRRREKHYRASSGSSGEDRAEASPPRAGHAPGGTPGDFHSPPAGGRSPRPGLSGWSSRPSARGDHCRLGAGRRSPAPSGAADDDRSSAFETVDFDQDDSFRSVLGLIRSFHGMEEPAGVPSARCKTSLASIYGLMTKISPAFALPASPLVRSLLDGTNLALAKFLEDQTVHGFLPMPGRCHRRYYCTSSSSFPGPYSVPPGITSITLEKGSEVKKWSVSLSASQVSSMETMLSGVSGLVVVGLVAVNLWELPRAFTGRGSCRLRTVNALWVEGLGIPG